jgi:hypothetical protein
MRTLALKIAALLALAVGGPAAHAEMVHTNHSSLPVKILLQRARVSSGVLTLAIYPGGLEALPGTNRWVAQLDLL